MNRTDEGFTVVETVVTLIVAVIFLLAINTVFITVIRATASSRSRATASNLAYSYLRKYAYTGADTSWFACDSNSDMQQNPSATGQQVEHGSLTSTQTTLPQPVSYAIVALAPYGCSGANATTPLLVQSTVTYGPDNLSISHGTYVGIVQ